MSSVVNSVGNSWITCRSKTFGGRIYYFNTLTGEAAWNLSESEIEKAKISTPAIRQSDFNIDNCPEPTEFPQDLLHKPKTPDTNIIRPKIYNKQIINNRFPKQGNILPTQLPHYPVTTINPLQFNIPITASFNPSLWNVSTQPILVTSINQPQHVINGNVTTDGIVPSRTSIPLSLRFQNLKKVNCRNSPEKRVYNRNFKNRFKKNTFNTNQNNRTYTHRKDLRLLLSSKRKNSKAHEIADHRNLHYNEEAGTSMQTPLKISSFLIGSNIEDDEVNEQSSFKFLDTTYLKTILHINTTDMWYIITDSNILINHVDFLWGLLKSDSQCRLVILQSVMNKIHDATNTRFHTRAHRSAKFISEKLDENLAILVKEESAVENVQDKYQIIHWCTKFINKDIHMIILTDDIELHCCDNTLPIYTLRELLKILNSRTPNTNPKSPESIESTTQSRSIKITIPNDTCTVNCPQEVAYSQESNTSHQTTIDDKNEHLLEREDLAKEPTDDVGVLADTVQVPKIDKKLDNKNTNIFGTNKPINEKLDDFCVMSETHSMEPKKHFTWHKRRYKCRQISETSECCSENSDNFQSTVINHEDNCVTLSELSNSADRSKDCDHETSSSSAILNTESFKHTASKEDSVNDKTDKVIREDKNVMFEITSEVMEEYLRMKCDEWISRFVQIMEEALTQVLQTDPPYILEMMPPPWNIYEGVECVKRKFSSDLDVVDASNKLSNILFESGGLRGKIKIDLSPNMYMEMYSYGVYLIDALQGVLNNNEDLQVAAETLAKLLSDIEDPHLDPINQDSFADTGNQATIIQDKICNENCKSKVESAAPVMNNTSHNSRKTTNSETNSSPSNKCNLSSHRITNIKENEESPRQVTFIRNIDLESSFFSNLDLKKNLFENKINAEKKTACNLDSNLVTDKVQYGTEKFSSIIKDTNEKNENQGQLVETKISEPKIIRNFTKCLEFEEKLKNNFVQNDNQESTIPNETYYGNEELDNEVEDEYYYQNNYDYNDTEFHEYPEDYQSIDEDYSYNSDNDVSFQNVFYKIEDCLKKEFQSMHEFCEKSYAVLSTTHSDVEKNKIKVQAEETNLHLNNLCEVLHSIIKRETGNSAYRIQYVFTVGENFVNEEELGKYKSFICKCLEQGNILKEAVELVIEACAK